MAIESAVIESRTCRQVQPLVLRSDRCTAELYFADCHDLLPIKADAVVSDPPYGMAWDTDTTRFSGGQVEVNRGQGRADWGEIENDATPFDPAPWLDYPRVILWGANHYAARLPIGTTLVWLKKADHLFGTWLSDAELGWMKTGHGVYAFRKQFPPPSRMAEGGGKVLHPTQKPVALMDWCLARAKVPEGGTVLDPFMGSGTTGVACVRRGLSFIGVEKDERYFEVAAERIRRELQQRRLW